MSGFVGWKLAGGGPVDATGIERGWPRGTTSTVRDLAPGQGLVFNRTREPIFHCARPDGWAVVCGWPRWRDSALSAIAAEADPAAAALAAFERHGAQLTDKIGGSFSLAVVDRKTAAVFLAVDRFCTRPLAFCSVRGGIVFGSTVEGVRRHARVAASVDSQAVYDYFFFHVVPSPRTIYREIAKLEPAEAIVHSPSGVTRRQHWNPPLWSKGTAKPTADLRSAIPTVLAKAVRDCAPDAGYGAYLSGGLDSSAVAGFLSRAREAPTPAYCVGFDQAGYDEMDYARIAAKRFGLALREIYVTPSDIVEVFEKIASLYDEPFGNSSAAPAYLCARRAAADGIKSLLAGDGGDEIFGGNDRYVRQAIFEHYWKLPTWARKSVLEPLLARSAWPDRLPLVRKAASYVRQASVPMPNRTQTYNLLCRLGPSAIFEPEFLAAVDQAGPFESLARCYSAARTDSLLGKMLYMDWKFTLADNDLPKVRTTAEFADVAVQYPMLDDEVVDLSIRIPDDEKIVGTTLRKFYKDALADFLPQEIIAKKKHGFGLPFGEWLNSFAPLRSVIFDSLSTLRTKHVVRKEFLDSLMNEQRLEHAAYYGGSIWIFAMFSRWLTEHRVDV